LRAAQEWLKKPAVDEDAKLRQRLLLAATACFGAFAGGNRRRAETARQTVTERLRRKHAR